jgi:hypothetical protein
MVRQRSLKAQEREILLAQAVTSVKLGLYKSSYAAVKALNLKPNNVHV